MPIPFIDLAAQQRRIRASVERRLLAVLDSCRFVMGPEIAELEKLLADYCGVRHAVGCASGTDALVMALMAWKVGPGDAVFCPSFTFMATAESVALVGATPVFVDIDPVTFNMDPARLEADVASVLAAGKLRPRGVIPVDLFGIPADYPSIQAVADRHGLFVLEDAAQSFGGEGYGKRCCAFGHAACTSFFPAKPLGCYGDGGMIFTDSDELKELLCSIRVHGQGSDKYENVRLGVNGRLDTMQAAVLLAKMEIFDDELANRDRVAAAYSARLAGADGLTAPTVPAGMRSAWAQYSLLARDGGHREEVFARLKRAEVPYMVYYPIPLHLQKAFAGLGYVQGSLPVTEDAARRIFSLPMHPYLSEAEIDRIAAAAAGR